MNIISVDTCNSYCSLGMHHHNRFFDLLNNQPNMQSFSLTKMIEEILNLAGIKFTEIDKIIFTNGPGSFTGIRVGLAFALGLKIANITKIVTLNNLSAYYLNFLTENQYYEGDILVVNKAMRDNFYYSLFSRKGNSPLMLGTLEDISPFLKENPKVTGNSFELKSKIVNYTYYENIKMSNLIRLYLPQNSKHRRLFDESGEIKPLYLREAL